MVNLFSVESITQEPFDFSHGRFRAERIRNHADKEKKTLTVEEIQDMVEDNLMDLGYNRVAKKYILYRNERTRLRNAMWEMSDLQRDIYEQKYRWKGEDFQGFLDRISGNNPVIAGLIREKKFIPAGRILAGRGTNVDGRKVCYSNCFVTSEALKDSLPSIFDTAKDLAVVFSKGGGNGLNLNYLRPRGSKVNNTAKTSTGAVSFMELFSTVTGIIGQQGRRSALMITMPITHPDVEEFIDVKNDLTKVTNANISVGMTDDFMESVKNVDRTYKQTFNVIDTGEVIEKKVDPLMLMRKIATSAWNQAEPGLIFWDNINNYHINDHNPDVVYETTNPCLSYETEILTDKGYQQIGKLVDTNINVWNGYRWSSVTPKVTGKNQEMLRVSFSNGSQINCTKYHSFLLQNGKRVEAQSLKVGDRLPKWELPVIQGHIHIDKDEAYTQGFYSGDGTFNKDRNNGYIYLYQDKKQLEGNLVYEKKWHDNSNRTILKMKKMKEKCFVPDSSYTIKTRLSWLAGYIDADGSYNGRDSGITASSIDKEFLLKIKKMLDEMGVHSVVDLMHSGSSRLLPSNDGTGGLKEYQVKDCYRICISSSSTKKLKEMGLETNRVKIDFNPNRDASRFITITSVEHIADEETVYCLNEPHNHTFIANGILTGNCGEKPLIYGNSCLLSSINLEQYVLNSFTEFAEFDYISFSQDVMEYIKFMDDLVDEGIPFLPLEKHKEIARDYRSVGLGVMGLGNMLIRLGLTYGKPESLTLLDKVFHTMANASLQQSAYLARDKGTYPKYNKELVLKSNYLNAVASNETWDLIEKYGLRNSEILSVAPSGSISSMLATSGGVEPNFQFEYNRRTITLNSEETTYKVVANIVREYRETTGNQGELPEYFVTAYDIPWKERIDLQATVQKYIDSAISSTVNLPEETSIEEVEELYQYAWEQKLKGVTIYRQNCQRQGILTTTDSKSAEEIQDEKNREIVKKLEQGICPECGGDNLIHEAGCMTCADCSYSPCSI